MAWEQFEPKISGYVEAEKTELVSPTFVDGGLWKYCELPDCDTYFEVNPRSQGHVRYCDGCRPKVKKLKARIRNRAKNGKTCARCGEKRPRSQFPAPTNTTRGNNQMGTCLYCSPFFFQYENQRAPKCGKFPKELGGSVFVATCPLYDLCAKRVTRELWAPCESPDRSDLLYIHGLDDDEYIEALELLELGFDQSGQVANQGLRFWLNHYEAVLNDLS